MAKSNKGKENPINPKEKAFCEYYCGLGVGVPMPGVKAYALAFGEEEKLLEKRSYHALAVNAHGLLKKAKIKAYIEEIQKTLFDHKLELHREIKAFWADTMRGHTKGMHSSMRMAASDYLAKSTGAYNDAKEKDGTVEKLIDIIQKGQEQFGGKSQEEYEAILEGD